MADEAPPWVKEMVIYFKKLTALPTDAYDGWMENLIYLGAYSHPFMKQLLALMATSMKCDAESALDELAEVSPLLLLAQKVPDRYVGVGLKEISLDILVEVLVDALRIQLRGKSASEKHQAVISLLWSFINNLGKRTGVDISMHEVMDPVKLDS